MNQKRFRRLYREEKLQVQAWWPQACVGRAGADHAAEWPTER